MISKRVSLRLSLKESINKTSETSLTEKISNEGKIEERSPNLELINEVAIWYNVLSFIWPSLLLPLNNNKNNKTGFTFVNKEFNKIQKDYFASSKLSSQWHLILQSENLDLEVLLMKIPFESRKDVIRQASFINGPNRAYTSLLCRFDRMLEAENSNLQPQLFVSAPRIGYPGFEKLEKFFLRYVKGVVQGFKNDLKLKDILSIYCPQVLFVPNYTLVYNLSVQRAPYLFDEEMYIMMKALFLDLLNQLMIVFPSSEIPSETLRRYNEASKYIQKVFMYLEQYYIPHYRLPSIEECRDNIFKEYFSYENSRKRKREIEM